ncbi:hypothetical protein [Burkholderia ubonensis]|uniref:hypothetical protein n=1 Tax=Burkholderia ubonensis TaxID=101571 RepID=UPI00075FF606|nr:hypothetical protein [Burkholderia ubonensis]KWO76312.1 hypothetical protein WM31_03350 [Burkholderia ubonensis]
MERIEQSASEFGDVVVEPQIVLSGDQRERLKQAFDVEIIRVFTGDGEPSGNLGITLRKHLHRSAKQRHLALEMRKQVIRFHRHARSWRKNSDRSILPERVGT